MYQQVPQPHRGAKKKNLDPVMKLLKLASKTTEGPAPRQENVDDHKTKPRRSKVGPTEPARRPEPPAAVRPIRKKNRREQTWEDSMFIKEDVIFPQKEIRGGLAIMLGRTHPYDNSSLSDDLKHNFSSSSLIGRTRVNNARKATSKGTVVSVIFQELMDLDVPPLAIPFTERTTIEDLMNISVIQHMHERKNKPPLAGQMGEQYELRIVDEDDSDMEIEMDLPPLGREKLIADLNLPVFAMCFKGKRTVRHMWSHNRIDDIRPPQISINLGLDNLGDEDDEYPGDARQKRIISLSGLNTGDTIDFIRITIPGPSVTTMTLHLQKDIQYTIQDLFPMVNKKRRENFVNSEFFSFYYTDSRRLVGGPLPNRMSAHHLTKDELILLPSLDICDKIHEEGFSSKKSEVDQLPLLSVLRPKEFKVWKLGERGKKKSRKLAIGRYLIRKTVLEDNSLLKKDHVPIEIGKISKCQRSLTSKRIFNLIYNHITGNQSREQMYEAASEEQCAEIVDKINFFRKLSIYYGSEDKDGEVVRARKARTLTKIRRRNM